MQDTNLKNSSSPAAIDPLTAALRRLDMRLADQVEFLLNPIDGNQRANVFEQAKSSTLECLKSKLLPAENKSKNFSWALAGIHLKALFYIPIRAFRGPPARLWPAVDKLWIFHSSGTTSGVEGKSLSGYSPEGLSWYRAASIATFFGVLERCFPSKRDDLLSICAVSLIPTPTEWPDSSLAKMVAWFAEIWSTHYTNPDDPVHVKNSIAQASKSGAPIYVFGTAFHFVNLLESGATFSLPSGSIVIETGGTKGRSRSVTREELYELIGTGFGVAPSQIISEYGMCELASQAWDLVDPLFASEPNQGSRGDPKNLVTHLSNRSFKFPWWVSVAVMNTPSNDLAEGEGALTIYDPLRIDVGDVAIQTEDLANLLNQSFQLRGRVPRAALKGCSLRILDAAAPDTSTHVRTASKAEGKVAAQDFAQLEKNSRSAHKWITDLLANKESLARLTLELGSEILALDALLDLRSGFPLNFDKFRDAALDTHSKTQKSGSEISQHWLMIPPSSHSLAFIHPLTQAFALGLSVRIRLPSIHALHPEKTFLALAVNLAQAAGFDLTTLDVSWRLGREDLLDGEKILVFGDDETCKFMTSFAPGRVSAFGNLVSLTVVNAGKDCESGNDPTASGDFSSQTSIASIVRDQLSLAQRGCLSSRAIITIGGDPRQLGERLATAIRADLFVAPPPNGDVVARAIEEVRLMQNGFTIFAPKNDSRSANIIKPSSLTIATKSCRLDSLAQDLTTGLGNLDLVITVFILPEFTAQMDIICATSKVLPLKVVSLGEKLFAGLSEIKNRDDFPKDIQAVKLGTLGAPPFDGLHMGRGFFAT
jgi:hypothetical protein